VWEIFPQRSGSQVLPGSATLGPKPTRNENLWKFSQPPPPRNGPLFPVRVFKTKYTYTMIFSFLCSLFSHVYCFLLLSSNCICTNCSKIDTIFKSSFYCMKMTFCIIKKYCIVLYCIVVSNGHLFFSYAQRGAWLSERLRRWSKKTRCRWFDSRHHWIFLNFMWF